MRNRKRDERDERGVALIEFVVIFPLIALILFGVIEWGMAYRSSLTITHSSRVGVRTAISMGKDPSADWQILQAVNGAAAGDATVEQVIIYKATDPAGEVPAACLTGGQFDSCNVYDPSDLALTELAFRAAGYTKDDDWAASTRNISTADVGGADYIGVYIRANYHSFLGVSFDDQQISERAVMRFDAFTVVPTTTTTTPTVSWVTASTTTTTASSTTSAATTSTTAASTTTTAATTTTTIPTTTSTAVGPSTTTAPPTTTTTVPTTTTTRPPTTTTTRPPTTTTTNNDLSIGHRP